MPLELEALSELSELGPIPSGRLPDEPFRQPCGSLAEVQGNRERYPRNRRQRLDDSILVLVQRSRSPFLRRLPTTVGGRPCDVSRTEVLRGGVTGVPDP
jgi:hypothetical protein